MPPLPQALVREPLVNAVFEVRFNGAPPLADLLPRFLVHDLGKGTSVSRLPAAGFTYPMRKEDTNLQFAPVQRVDAENFAVLVGDHNVVVRCK